MSKSQITYAVKSPRLESIKIIKEFELAPPMTSDAMTRRLFEVCSDEQSLRKLCGAIFSGDFSEINPNDIDLTEVVTGLGKFLKNFLNPTAS